VTDEIEILEDRNGGLLFPIRCRGCGRVMGWGTAPLPGIRLFCSAPCAIEGQPIGDNERRNDLIRQAVASGWTATKAGNYFGLSRQRVNQFLETPSEQAARKERERLKKAG
jgi:hypothetical protein